MCLRSSKLTERLFAGGQCNESRFKGKAKRTFGLPALVKEAPVKYTTLENEVGSGW